MKAVGVLLWLLMAVTSVHAERLFVSAAISLKDALEEAARAHPLSGFPCTFNFASSGVLQRQIETGAPCDLFLSAAWKPVRELAAAGWVVPDSTRVVARNALVLIVPRRAETPVASVRDLLRAKRIVIGNPKTVPAGEYARQSLAFFGLWDALPPRLILAEHVRQALDYVEGGEVDAGLVYASDAAGSGAVRVVETLPEESHEPIEYPAAIPRHAANPAQAENFLKFLLAAEGQAILTKHGFQARETGTQTGDDSR